jgi:hypothetical protein
VIEVREELLVIAHITEVARTVGVLRCFFIYQPVSVRKERLRTARCLQTDTN